MKQGLDSLDGRGLAVDVHTTAPHVVCHLRPALLIKPTPCQNQDMYSTEMIKTVMRQV